MLYTKNFGLVTSISAVDEDVWASKTVQGCTRRCFGLLLNKAVSEDCWASKTKQCMLYTKMFGLGNSNNAAHEDSSANKIEQCYIRRLLRRLKSNNVVHGPLSLIRCHLFRGFKWSLEFGALSSVSGIQVVP